MRTLIFNIRILLPFFALLIFSVNAAAQTTAFTYQGKLTDTGTPSATYDFEFNLCDSETGDCSLPLATQQIAGVPVSGGVFTVTLDFAAGVFDGSDHWLEIKVKRPAQGTYTTLSPRQFLTSAPYAIRSLNAANADLFSGLTTNNFIQNTMTQQTGNFNISGNGIIGGNLGIGITPSAATKLDVNGQAIIRPGGSGGSIGFGNPNGETGLTINAVGTNRADIRFDNNTLKLVVGTPGGPPPSTNGILIDFLGRVGVGGDPIGGEEFQVFGSSRFQGDLSFSGGNTNISGVNNIEALSADFAILRILPPNGGGDQNLCRNSVNREISTCGSSLRYKTNISSFGFGLSVVNQLRPISFDWKQGGMKDVGFGAEDVAQINPLFVTYNDKGEVEGVKYDRLSVVFVNAIKEQQAQIEQQKSQIEQQQQQLDGLKEIVCSFQPQAKICQ